MYILLLAGDPMIMNINVTVAIWLKRAQKGKRAFHGSEAAHPLGRHQHCPPSHAMPLSPEDIQAITQVVSQTVSAMLQAQGMGPAQQGRQNRDRDAEHVNEKHYRKISQFKGKDWKDWSFQFKSATKSSSKQAYELLCWAEKETVEIPDFTEYSDVAQCEESTCEKISGELFNLITTMVQDEPLQLMHNCDFNGAEGWRRLAKRYSPSTPLRAMQLLLQVVNPGKVKHLKDVPGLIDRWEIKVLALERDFKESLSPRMKAAILISMLPADLQDSLVQNAEKYHEYPSAKEKVLSIVEAKMSMRDPDAMDVDNLSAEATHGSYEEEDIQALGKGAMHCYRCGGLGHIAAHCATPEPTKGGGKGSKGAGKGKSKGKGFGNKGKGKGTGEWTGYCSYCGKRGHGPRDCWSKAADEAAAGDKGGLAAVAQEEYEAENQNHEICGFDIACLDICGLDDNSKNTIKKSNMSFNALIPKPQVQKPKSIGHGRITIDSGAAESVLPKDMLKEVPLKESKGSRSGLNYVAANGGRMPNLGEKNVNFRTKDGRSSNITFQVTSARKPLVSVSRIVQKGNKVIFAPGNSYIENMASGKRIELEEINGTYHIDVEYLAADNESDFTGRD